MTETVTVVDSIIQTVTVVEPGPQGPAGTGGEEVAADLAQEITDRQAGDAALSQEIIDERVDRALAVTEEATARAAADTANSSALSTHAASTTAHGIGTAAALASDTDNTLAANSDSKVATQKATKGYVDTASGLLVPKSLVDAKGDLLVGTANDTVARKAVGSNGKVLVADSGQSDGLKWGGPSDIGAVAARTYRAAVLANSPATPATAPARGASALAASPTPRSPAGRSAPTSTAPTTRSRRATRAASPTGRPPPSRGGPSATSGRPTTRSLAMPGATPPGACGWIRTRSRSR